MANRLDGIMSGLDTQSLVKAAVSSQQNQIDRLVIKNQRLAWQRTAYTSMYTQLDAFRNKVYNYKLDATTQVKSASSSNESSLGVKVGADATVGTYNVTIHQLAAGAQTGSSEKMGSSDKKTSLQTQFVNQDGTAKYSGEFKIQINGKDITVDTSKSMNEMVKQINNSGAGVTASYDANTDRFFITSNETGAEAKIDFNPVDSNGVKLDLNDPANAAYAKGADFLQNALKMSATVDDTDPLNPVVTFDSFEGKNAIIDLNGVKGIEQTSNEFTISGVTYDLKEADENKSITVTVKNDTDAVMQSVRDFVSMYNEMLASINSVTYEQKVKGYDALTDAQKESMTAEQIDKWELNAKKGILRTDSILMSISSSMRSTVYSTVAGAGALSSLISLGVTTKDYSSNGELKIDEEKLRAAIEKDPDAVNKVFNGGVDSKGNRTEGIADKLYDELKKGMDKIDAKAGSASGEKELTSNIAKALARNNTAISKKTTAMNNRMATLYKQYDAMEKLLQQLQSQQSSLESYFSS